MYVSYGILNGQKKLWSGILQNYFVYIPAKNALHIFMPVLRFIRGNLMECQRKILKI